MMTGAIGWLEQIFESIPLPILEVWGRFGFILGLPLMLCAFAGLTFRPHDRWGIGRQRQTWDGKAFLSMILTFALIFVTGYIGSTIVLVPGAQTFESLKDLSVFLCLILFGYPALIIVPFAYGLSDLMEGVPPGFLLAWLPGYFINPACFWMATQLLGRDPDFKKARTWKRYLIFVLLFMTIEPLLWGYLCSAQFTSGISYRSITPALFFTTLLTWIMAPGAMLLALPLARRYGFFWPEIPGHVHERSFNEKVTQAEGLPLRMVLALPFIVLLLTMVGSTAYLALKSSEETATKLARHLHEEIAENILLNLNNYMEESASDRGPYFIAGLQALLKHAGEDNQGITFIIDDAEQLVAASYAGEPAAAFGVQLQEVAIKTLKESQGSVPALDSGRQFTFDVVRSKPLSRETWMAQATPYRHAKQDLSWMVLTVIPAAFYQEGVRIGNSQSAMILALALALSLIAAVTFSSMVTAPIKRIADATHALARGDLSRRVPGGPIEELQALSQSFNHMAGQLQESFQRSRLSEEMFRHLVETTPGIVWQADPNNFHIMFISQQAEILLGYSVEDFQKPDFVIKNLHPMDRKKAIKFYRQSVKRNQAQAIEYRFFRKDGSMVWLRDTVKAIQKSEGSCYLHGVIIDITDRKIAEEALEIVKVKAETALDLAKAGYWHVPIDGSGLYYSSPRTVQIFGDIPNDDCAYSIEEAWYSNVLLGDEAAAIKFRQILADAVAGQVDVLDTTYAYKRPVDGRVIWIHAMGKILRNLKGVPIDIYGVAQDITDFKNAEDDVKRMNSLLEQRVAERTEKLMQATKNLIESSRKAGMAEVAIGVLHNIGNALTIANIKVQNLHLDLQNKSAIRHLHEVMDFMKSKGDQLADFMTTDTNGQRMLHYLDSISQELWRQEEAYQKLVSQLCSDLNLISQLITKQQLSAKYTGVVENLSLTECLEDVLAIQAYDLEKYRIHIDRVFMQNPVISTDRHKLIQILSNLISNAVQAMHKNAGERILTIEVRELGEHADIVLRDNGIGISDEQMPHMFRYGYTTKQTGHGFGLHSSSIDAKLLGGNLSCSSTGRHQGATFTLTLPIRPFALPEEMFPSAEDIVGQRLDEHRAGNLG